MSKRIEDIVFLATKMLQEHLNSYGHGTVEDVDIDELGWSEECTPIQLMIALREYEETR